MYPLRKIFIAFEVEQRRLQQALVLHRLVAPQIKQPVVVHIERLAGGAMAVQGLLEPGLGELGNALQVFEGRGQRLIRQTTARL